MKEYFFYDFLKYCKKNNLEMLTVNLKAKQYY